MKTKFKHTKILEEANSESISGLFHFYFHSLVGEKTIRVTHDCNRENATDGKVMDPLIIFREKYLKSSWLGKNNLKDTYFAVSESGCMTTIIFHGWLEKFIKKVETRPILLVFDGPMTHLSLATVQLAKAENISLAKLPAHCTDVMQPLDVSCFSPLKNKYEQLLTEVMHRTGGRQQLSKAAFQPSNL